MKKLVPTILCAAFLAAGLAGPLSASGLKQRNPARKAPTDTINHPGTYNEYPWFSYDGRLMFWTREDPRDSQQELYVAYIKNWNQIANKGPGATLPVLKVGPDDEFDDINLWINGNPAFEMGSELRALAVCTKRLHRQRRDESDQWVYPFSLYFSVRRPDDEAAPGQIFRTIDIEVAVNKSTFQADILTEFDTSSSSSSFFPVVPPAGSTHNETEPFFSRDSRYFFWGSNKWTQGGVAEYIGPKRQCTQAMQTPVAYSTLPSTGPGDYFAWKDQYAGAGGTSRTNYHTLATKTSGQTALIFEECHGKTKGGGRDGWCQANNERLSTTGFDAGKTPTNIDDSGWDANAIHGDNPVRRASHPAISGPQLSDGSFLLFFMRDKAIFFTKVEIVP